MPSGEDARQGWQILGRSRDLVRNAGWQPGLPIRAYDADVWFFLKGGAP